MLEEDTDTAVIIISDASREELEYEPLDPVRECARSIL